MSGPSSTPSPPSPSSGPFGETSRFISAKMRSLSKTDVDVVCNHALNQMVDDIVLALCFDLHRSVKTGAFSVTEIPSKEHHASSSSSGGSIAVDVFGQVITTSSGVPALKKQPECVCPNCQRNLAASRFAPHLEKCMGMGRNSSRLASRRLANNNKDNYRGNDEEDDAEDEDWLEPGSCSAGNQRGIGGPSSSLGGVTSGTATKKRQRDRDKNSPRRNKGKSGNKTSGDSTPQEGTVTPPANFDQLSIEERSQWLSTICGVVSTASRRICSRSTRCPVHTDAQRRDVRIRWLAPNAPHSFEGIEESHVDIDSFSEGDTAALRESLAQLSNASSPAESTISTSSNPGISNTRSSSRREKGANNNRRANKKGKSGSKAGSRGSTPPIIGLD